MALGRLKGHPIHLLLVHFPSALYPFSIVLDWIGWYAGESAYSTAGYYALLAGVAGGALAAVFGAMDFLLIDSKDKAWGTAALHGLLNVIWLCAAATFLGIRLRDDPMSVQGLVYLISLPTITTGMLYSNFLGGELVLRHGIGQMRRGD